MDDVRSQLSERLRTKIAQYEALRQLPERIKTRRQELLRALDEATQRYHERKDQATDSADLMPAGLQRLRVELGLPALEQELVDLGDVGRENLPNMLADQKHAIDEDVDREMVQIVAAPLAKELKRNRKDARALLEKVDRLRLEAESLRLRVERLADEEPYGTGKVRRLAPASAATASLAGYLFYLNHSGE